MNSNAVSRRNQRHAKAHKKQRLATKYEAQAGRAEAMGLTIEAWRETRKAQSLVSTRYAGMATRVKAQSRLGRIGRRIGGAKR